MKIIYVDDEEIQLENFRITAKDIEGMEDLKLFSDSRQAYKLAKEHPVDVAFLNIEMPHMDGIELAKKLKEISRKTCIIFVTAYEQYALKAMNARPAGYLLKPYGRAEVGVSKQDAIACLWEGKQLADSTYGTCLYRLKNILEEAGISQLLAARGNTKYIDTNSDQLDCDLYRMLNEEKEAIAAYAGVYLRRYSWAEERTAQLNIIKKTAKNSMN